MGRASRRAVSARRPEIPRRALFLGVLIGAVIVAIALKIVWDLRVEAWRSSLRSSRDISRSISHDIERSIQSYDLSLKSVANDLETPGVMELPVDIRDRVLFDSSAKAKYLGPIVVLDSHGTIFIDSGSRIPRRGNLGGGDFFAFHRTHADPGVLIGHPVRDDDGRYRITLSRRVSLADGAFAGVVVGTMELAYFEDLFSRIDLGRGGIVSLNLDDGATLTRSPAASGGIGHNLRGKQPFDTMVALHDGDLEARSSTDSVRRQYVFTHVGSYPLLLAVAQSTDLIYGGWIARALWIGLFTAALLSCCGALALILQRELVRRSEAEAELFAQGERLQVTLGSIGDAVLSTDDRGHVLFMNRVAERLSGWSIDEARGRPARDILRMTCDDMTDYDPIGGTLVGQQRDTTAANLLLGDRRGGVAAVEESASPVCDREGVVIGAVIVLRDVSEARRMAVRMSHLARHDTLTDLPNRRLVEDRLAVALEQARSGLRHVAVLYIDLDRFKHVNDSLGHAAGDRLLVEVARRLRSCVREGDTVGRQGGDEFIVLLANLGDEQGPARVAESVLARLAEPFDIDGRALSVTASVGVATFPADGGDGETLIRNADAAMYLVKGAGRNACQFFTSDLGEQAARRLDLEQRMAAGIATGEFVLHFQPMCRASDGMPVAAEALVRWMRDGKTVAPNEFIPLAEDSGLIVPLGDEILRMACRHALAWNEGRREAFVVAVNVSAHQFRSATFVDRVRAILDASSVDPRCLEIEITESVLLQASETTVPKLRALKALGISIALDDFGTGYSSLSYLRQFPVDRIKIDRSFIHAIATDDRDRAIVRAIIGLGLDLGLQVIAEGVETIEQRKILNSLRCPHMQGFLFGRPHADYVPLRGFERSVNADL